jgi:hypothetical protein
MGVHVDKTGTKDPSPGIDMGISCRQAFVRSKNVPDPITINDKVAGKRRLSRTVNDQCIFHK